MKHKILCCIFICLVILMSSLPLNVLALEDDGSIDLYEVFSDKKDLMITEVGSKIFKWSMHLPDDAIVYKSDRVNYFNMYTDSYKSRVNLEVIKNENKHTLEDILYSQQRNNNNYSYYWYFTQKEFISTIAVDSNGEKHIKIVKMDPFYDYYLVDDAAEEFSSYIENRIYVKNDYIYNIEFNMDGAYYRENPEMFDKLTSSFKLSYDTTNPHIKELSDSVSEHRLYENTSYGWNITVNPYWKEEGISNARVQQFNAVYSHDEIYGVEEEEAEDMHAPERYLPFREGITVSLVSSALPTETAAGWAKEEVEKLKQNYHEDLYDVLISEELSLGNVKGYRVKVKYKTVPKNPYVVDTVYVIGNGYKYKAVANISDKKYNEPKTKEAFESMLKSFRLTQERSIYLGKILDPSNLINWNETKEIKTKKYNFKTTLTKNWHTNNDFFNMGYHYGYYDYYYMNHYSPYMRNQESIYAYHRDQTLQLTMMAGLDARELDDIIEEYVENLLYNDEIRIGLATVSIESAYIDDIQIYKITTEYDLTAMNEFAKEDETKFYDYSSLNNQYTYMVKINNDLYTQTVTLPVAHTTSQNINEMKKVWEHTEITGVNFSKKIRDWHMHNPEEFLNN